MYPTVLLLHSRLRWAVILLGLSRRSGRSRGRRPGGRVAIDDRIGKLFMHALDLQMLLGLVLYFFLSPITKAAMSDFGGQWGSRPCVLGPRALARDGHRHRPRACRNRPRPRATDAARKHRTLAIFFVLAMLAILASIPGRARPTPVR